MYTTVESVFTEGMPSRFNAKEAQHESCSYLFKVRGAGEWFVNVSNGKLQVAQGVPEGSEPDCILDISEEDYLDMVNGKESIQIMFMTGKLQITGDLPYAVKLARFFPTVK